jgi:hypothetical protein
MASFKRQSTALGLLLLAALPVLISAGLFVKQSIIQRHREERFELETLQTITVSLKEVIWLKAEKEILYNGKMFDVKSFKQIGTNLELTGFFDHVEDKLVKQTKNLVQQKEDGSSKSDNMVVKFLFSPKFNAINNFSIENSWQNLKCQFPFYADAPLNPIERLSESHFG